METVYEDQETYGSGPTLDEAVADAVDRFKLRADAATDWKYDLAIEMALVSVHVEQSSDKYQYSPTAPNVSVRFNAIARKKS